MIHTKSGLYSQDETEGPMSSSERIAYLEEEVKRKDLSIRAGERAPEWFISQQEVDAMIDERQMMIDEIQRLESAQSDQFLD